MDLAEPIDDASEPRQRARRSWLFRGSPPSSASVGVGAGVYTAIASWWGGGPLLTDLVAQWQESPRQYLITLVVISVILSLFMYAMLRVALPLVRPRVTRRWRNDPLIMRTASLAQSIIFFRALELVPALMIGTGSGQFLTIAASIAGFGTNTPAPGLVVFATAIVSAGLAAALAKRQAAKSGYKPLLRVW